MSKHILSPPTVEAMCRLHFASGRVADTLTRRREEAFWRGEHTITLSLDEAKALADDAYETERLAQWTYNRLKAR